MFSKVKLLLLIVLAYGCQDHDLDAEKFEHSDDQVPSNNNGNITAVGLPPLEIEPPQLFVLNPADAERSVDQFNLSQTSTVNKTIVMESEQQPKQQSLTAKLRSWHSKQVTQTGSSGTSRTETFTPSTDKGLLDLLLVIDDSKSMQDEHEHLKGDLASLLNDIDNSNWQINIIDVDDRQMCDHTIVTSNSQSAYDTKLVALKNKAQSNPNVHERTLKKAQAALGITNSCAQWLRADSTLAVVLITDEDHQCTNSSASDNRGDDNSFYCDTEVSDFISSFRALRTNTGLYGIFNNKTTCASARSSAYSQCFRYNENNVGSNICLFTNPCYRDADGSHKWRSGNYLAEQSKFDMISYVHGTEAQFKAILTSIAANVKDKLQDQFTLAEETDSGAAVTVAVDGTTQTSGYTLSGKLLTFTQAVSSSSTISVTYVPKGGVKTFVSDIVVSSQADMSTVQVTVAGSTLTKDTHYTISGSTVTISNVKTNFPAGTVATIRWQKKQSHDPKQKEFRFGGSDEVVAGTVSIAGYAASSYDFYTNPNRVVFKSNQEPAYGAQLNVSYEHYSRDKLSYPLNYSGTYPITSISCSVSCSHSGNSVTFSSGDFTRGNSVTVTLTVQGLQSDRRPVPQHYVPDSLQLALAGTTCTAEQLVIKSSELMLVTTDAQDNGCQMLADLNNNINQDLTFSYLAYTPKQEVEVSLDGLLEYAGYKAEIWEVYVAGQKKEAGKDYTVSGRKITFKDNYPIDTKGKIKISVVY